MALPSAVYAADWTRTVTFPAEGGDRGTPVMEWFNGDAAICTGSGFGVQGFQTAAGGAPVSLTWTDGYGAVGGICKASSAFSQWWIPDSGVTGATYALGMTWGGDTSRSLTVYWAQGTLDGVVSRLADAVAMEWTCTTGGSFQGTGSCMNSTQETQLVAPAGAVGLEFAWSGGSVGPESILIEPIVNPVGGDCFGVGLLAWGAAGLTGASANRLPGWGDAWTSTYAGCWAGSKYVLTYEPSDWVAGHEYEFVEHFGSGGGVNKARVRIEWMNATGPMGVVFDQVTSMRPEDGQGGYWKDWSVVSPLGSVGLQYTIYAATQQFEHTVSDVDVTGPGAGVDTEFGQPSIFDNCPGPENVLDLAGLAGYIGCVANNGLMIVVGFMVGLPGLMADAIAGTLEWLFMPTELATDWEAFTDLLGAKVPFVWVTAGYEFLTGTFTGANLAGSALPATFAIMGADVSLNLAAVFTPLAGFRGVFTALVFLGCSVAIWRQIGGALGAGGQTSSA